MKLQNPKLEYEGKLEDYPLENYPDYRPGKLPDTEASAEIPYLDEVERIWGKKWGNQGLGTLREVALTRPPEIEFSPLWERDLDYYLLKQPLNRDRMFKAYETYEAVFKSEGVKVHWMEIDNPMGAYGPMRNNFMGSALVVNGGAVLARYGYSSWVRGRNWNYQKFFAKIGCPILYMVHGTGILEPAVWVAGADDVIFGNRGASANDDGIEQVTPVLHRSGYREVVIGSSTILYENFASAGEFHMDMVLGFADLGIALIYPGHLDYRVFKWLKDHRFRIIEIPPDEQAAYYPANLIVVKPGRVIVPAGAKKTIKKLKEAEVEVIDLETGPFHTGINGLRCVTLPLVRDAGPKIDDWDG